MLEQLKKIESHYEELCSLLMDPDIAQNPSTYADYAKEKRSLDKTVAKYREYLDVLKNIEDDESLIKEESDAELLEMAELELEEMGEKKGRLEEELKRLLLPKDPR